MLWTGCPDISIRIVFIGFHDSLVATERPEELILQVHIVSSRNN
jgi:hypothetical protein